MLWGYRGCEPVEVPGAANHFEAKQGGVGVRAGLCKAGPVQRLCRVSLRLAWHARQRARSCRRPANEAEVRLSL